MAIRSISRLQHRRGLKSDLPPKLYEGEIGWCVDTRELFIGNGEGYGGNTQLLTEWTRNDQLIQHAFHTNNGLDADSVIRSIGAKLDDVVNVRDYGAVGNGIADDRAAIQLAITDLYGRVPLSGFSPLSGRMTIYFPAGTYRISSSLLLYPFVKLQGEGAHRTQIVIDDVPQQNCVLQTVDSNGNTQANIGMDGAVLPQSIDIFDISLEQPKPQADIIWLQRSSRVRLERLQLNGPRTNGSGATPLTAAIRIQSLGDVVENIPKNIRINDCEMSGTAYAVYSDDPISDLHMNQCWIHDCWNGVVLGFNAFGGGPQRTKVINSVFTDLDGYGVAYFGDNVGVLSIGNSFDNVGLEDAVSPIYFAPGTTGCSSIADQFGPTLSTTLPVVDNLNPPNNLVFGAQHISINRNTPLLLGPVVLQNNNPVIQDDTVLQYDPTKYNNIILEYTITRGTSKRLGRLIILTDGTNVSINDEFTGLGPDMGISFSYRMSFGILIITYNSTNTGNDATMVYTEKKWLA